MVDTIRQQLFNVYVEITGVSHEQALWKALCMGIDHAVQYLLEFPRIHGNLHGMNGLNLGWACREGHDKIVRALHPDFDIDNNNNDDDGRWILYMALLVIRALVMAGYVGMIEHLIREGGLRTLRVGFDHFTCGYYHHPILHHAAAEGQLVAVDMLVSSVYPDPRAWHVFIMGCGNDRRPDAGNRMPGIFVDRVIDLIRSFLHKPRYWTDLNEVDSYGLTALDMAEMFEHREVAALLRKNGARDYERQRPQNPKNWTFFSYSGAAEVIDLTDEKEEEDGQEDGQEVHTFPVATGVEIDLTDEKEEEDDNISALEKCLEKWGCHHAMRMVPRSR